MVGPNYKLFQGNCLQIELDQRVDAVIADLPYGITQNKWDVPIPANDLWAYLKEVVKKNGVIVLFAGEPLASKLRLSNLDWYKYDWIWKKSHPSGHLNYRKMPMRAHDTILVFCEGVGTYNPQLTKKPERLLRDQPVRVGHSGNYGKQKNNDRTIPVDMTVPKSVIEFDRPGSKGKWLHPTQKPVALMEYLVRTYTNQGDVVLDCVMGSGSTGVACMRMKRSFIGVELNDEYCQIAYERIANAAGEIVYTKKEKESGQLGLFK